MKEACALCDTFCGGQELAAKLMMGSAQVLEVLPAQRSRSTAVQHSFHVLSKSGFEGCFGEQMDLFKCVGS